MRTLEGGCSVPIGVETKFLEDGTTLMLRASVSSVDGKAHVAAEQVVEGIVDVMGAEALGVDMAKKLLELGAGPILQNIQRSKDVSAQAAEGAKKEERQMDAMLEGVEQDKISAYGA